MVHAASRFPRARMRPVTHGPTINYTRSTGCETKYRPAMSPVPEPAARRLARLAVGGRRPGRSWCAGRAGSAARREVPRGGKCGEAGRWAQGSERRRQQAGAHRFLGTRPLERATRVRSDVSRFTFHVPCSTSRAKGGKLLDACSSPALYLVVVRFRCVAVLDRWMDKQRSLR